jgi:multiple sugar transport system substrate-binding protein
MAQYGADPNNYYEAVRNQATFDGQMYGIPEFMTTMNWLVNESAFSEANLDAASFDFSDWDAIRSANDALLQADGSTVSRIGIDPKVPEFFPLWAKANGVDLISADGTTAQIDQPEVLETLQFVVDLVNAHGGSSPFLDFRGTWDFFGAENEFAANQVGAFPYEQWYLNVLAGSSPDAPVRAAPFVDRQGNGVTMATGSSLAITTAATNPEAACAFAVTLTSEDAWVRAAEERVRIATEEGSTNTGVFIAHQPATERIFSDIIPADQIPAPWGENVQVYLDNWANAFALPPSPANATIFAIGPTASESIIATMIDRALQGEDLQQVLTEANADAQAAIDDAANQ